MVMASSVTLPICPAARLRETFLTIKGRISMRALDRIRQSIDVIFLYGLTAGLMMAIAAIILAKLPE
jgi:hypothetical protein